MLPQALQLPWKNLLEAFRPYPKPTQTTGCDCGICDLPAAKILALLEVPPERLGDSRDVRLYLENVRGTVGTDEDFTFLLPGLARIWAETDLPDEWYQENFWDALAKGEFMATQLSSNLRAALDGFLEASILRRLGLETRLTRIKGVAPSHSWSKDIGGFARVSDSLASLWNSWWDVPSEGHARAVLLYGSHFVYEKTANPYYKPQTYTRGGGPCLVELGGRPKVYWREANLQFLKSGLNVESLEAAFDRSVRRLRDPEEKRLAAGALDWLQRDREGTARRMSAFLEE
jgi:hypothetical protein